MLSLYPTGELCISNNPLPSVQQLQNVPLVAVSSIAQVKRGNSRYSGDYIKQHPGIYPVYTGSINGEAGFIDTYEYDGEFVTYINTSAGTGLVYYRNEKFNLNLAQTILLRLQPDVYDAKYLAYALSIVARQHVNTAGGMEKLNPDSFGRIKIPLPPIEVQKEIGEILFKFEQLIKNPKFGLKAEIKLRDQQFEYYLNKCFSFDEN